MMVQQNGPGLAIVALVAAFCIYTITTIVCRLQDKTLLVKSGIFYKVTIDIDQIKSIRKTRNPISSPAASLYRLEIRFNKFDSVIASPLGKKEFIETLQKKFPNGGIRKTSHTELGISFGRLPGLK